MTRDIFIYYRDLHNMDLQELVKESLDLGNKSRHIIHETSNIQNTEHGFQIRHHISNESGVSFDIINEIIDNKSENIRDTIDDSSKIKDFTSFRQL